MAQTRAGEARSVPDPHGELYNEMLRAKREGRLGADDTVYRRVAQDYFSPTKDRLAFARQPQVRKPGLQVDGRSVNAPSVVADPNAWRFTPAELGRQRQTINQTSFMAGNPLAATAYGIASVLGASPRDRDIALATGGAFDAMTQSVAPRGATLRRRPSPARVEANAPPLNLPPIRYRELNATGDAQGINAILAAPLFPTVERVPEGLRTPGLQPFSTRYWNARGHLAAAQLGGSSTDPRNFVSLTQNPTNSPWMSAFENEVARRVRDGEVIDYSVTPFGSAGSPPEFILMTASGSRGGPVARLVANLAKAPTPAVARLTTPRRRR
jgi:hypothetical protein